MDMSSTLGSNTPQPPGAGQVPAADSAAVIGVAVTVVVVLLVASVSVVAVLIAWRVKKRGMDNLTDAFHKTKGTVSMCRFSRAVSYDNTILHNYVSLVTHTPGLRTLCMCSLS